MIIIAFLEEIVNPKKESRGLDIILASVFLGKLFIELLEKWN